MKLYLDMDGVLMDYDQHIKKWGCDWRGDLYHHLPQSQWTVEQATNDTLYQDAMADPAFWATMGPMSDAHTLWSYCRPYRPHVLTATPISGTAYRDRCAKDKIDRIHRLFDSNFPVEDFHACLRHEKRAFAVEGHILVDDMKPNCEDWSRSGGTAILHTDAVSTIRKLQELLHVI